MKRKLPISIESVQFCIYERCDDDDVVFFIDQFPYDNRRDFAVVDNLAGISVKLEICNERYNKGARRNVTLSLIDLTSRYEVASESVKINLKKDMYVHQVFVNFPIETTALTVGHAYRLIVCDATSSSILTETVFHLFDHNNLGHPTKWYEIISAGIKPAWESQTYKVLKTVDCHDYYVRFTLTPKLNPMIYTVLPELEMRLYYPDGKRVTTHFNEPKYFGIDDYKDGILTVDYPFTTCDEVNGIFYAELLCMEYPVAGFVFDTERENMTGVWIDREIEPLDEYSFDAAVWRLNDLLPPIAESSRWSDKDFDDMLQTFIDSQVNETGPDSESETEKETTSTDSDEMENKADDSIKIKEEVQQESQQESLLPSLDSLTGLRDVKGKLEVYENVVRFNKERGERGLPITPTPLHAMFLGSPGTGKTTVAKMMGMMLRRAGLLSKGHVVVRERATLTGQFYSSEAEKTLAAIEEAKGGILFIDEAYQLHQPEDPRDPGKFVIETLLTALADETNRDWMLILAGYPDEMRRMFDLNPGFRSRIPDSNIYTFDDFSESELMEIAERYLERHHYSLTPEARNALAKRLTTDYEQCEKNFGNARHVINLIQTQILPSMAVRVIKEGHNDETSFTEIQMRDIPAPISKISCSRKRVGFIL